MACGLKKNAPEQTMRYAADDRDDVQASFSANGYTVFVQLGEDGWTATQTVGAAGASLKVGAEWVVLTPASGIDAIDALPEVWCWSTCPAKRSCSLDRQNLGLDKATAAFNFGPSPDSAYRS